MAHFNVREGIFAPLTRLGRTGAIRVGLAAAAVVALTASAPGVALTKALGEATATPNPFDDIWTAFLPSLPASGYEGENPRALAEPRRSRNRLG